MCPLLVTSHVQSCTAYSIHEKRYETWSKHEAPTLAGQRNLRKQDAIMTSKSGKSAPLSTATSGYHYHLIAADDEEALETIGRALADKGYLAPLLPHEMPK